MKNLLIAIAFLCSAYLHAQKTDTTKYNYSNFRCYDISYRALNLTLNGGMNYSGVNSYLVNFQGNGDFSLGYNKYLNKLLFQKNTTIFVNSAFDYKKYETQIIPQIVTTTKNSQYFYTLYSNTNRYYNTKGRYFEVSPELVISNQSDNTKNDLSNTSNQHFNFNVKVDLGYGIGRIDPITQVFAAKFIYDDLRKEGVLKDKVSESQLFELASEMTKMQNLRFLDSRRRNVKQMITLNKLLNSQLNLSEEEKYITSSVLMDNWFFAGLNARNSGKRHSFKMSPFYNYSYLNGNKSDQIGMNLSYNFDHEKPINQYFQFFQNYSVGLSPSSKPLLNIKPNFNLDILFNAKVGFGYYPSSRTSIETYVTISDFVKNNLDILNKSDYLNYGLYTKVNYFINYNTKLFATLNYYGVYKNNNFNNFNFNFGILHSFF